MRVRVEVDVASRSGFSPCGLCFAVIFGLFSGGCLIARAQEMVERDNFTLAEAVEIAVRDNPLIISLRAKLDAMLEIPVQAKALPNPMLIYSGMDMTEGGRWPDTGEKRIMLEQGFFWLGKRKLRAEIATHDAEIMQRELEATTLSVVMMVKENYFDLLAVQRVMAITHDEEEVLNRMAMIAETMYTTGGQSQQDVLKARTEITMLKQKLLELEIQETTLRARMNTLLGRRADLPLGLVELPPSKMPDVDARQLFVLAEQNRAEIKGAEAAIQRSQNKCELMKKEFWPDYRLGVEYRDFSQGENMVMVTVGFDLPIWKSKYRASVREAEKMIESSKAALVAMQRDISFEVQDAYSRFRSAQLELDLYVTELIPQAEARFKASEAGYRAGKVDFMDFLESERFLLSARTMAAMAVGKVGMQSARLERALGVEEDGW